jgi:hypothetical protein
MGNSVFTGSDLTKLGLALFGVSIGFGFFYLWLRKTDNFPIGPNRIVFYRSENPIKFEQFEKTAAAISIVALLLSIAILTLRP